MAGRPRASSRDTIADAACELFLEKGYAATTVADITTRAGVSRSSFFNYFATKADVVWAAWDERMDAAAVTIAAGGADVDGSLRGIGTGFAPDALVLAVAQSDAMGLGDELDRERAVRQAQLARTLAARLRQDGADPLAADVRAGALAAAVYAALWSWATDAPAAVSLDERIGDALQLGGGRPSPVRQLRLVVAVDDWEAAVAFYRDAAGMPVEAQYDADGGARVAILDAGRATLELSNAAQVAFIDRVETDGDAPSDPLRVGLEVTDAEGATARLIAAGAVLQASARETPWRSRNARLRDPRGLQLTLFEELGPE